MTPYVIFKTIHILGVVLFLGNIIITGVWKHFADRTANPVVIGFAQRLVTLTDWMFTFGGVLLILIGGYGAASVGQLDLASTSWLVLGQSIFIASGVIWVAILIPIQVWQARLARGFENGGEVPALGGSIAIGTSGASSRPSFRSPTSTSWSPSRDNKCHPGIYCRDPSYNVFWRLLSSSAHANGTIFTTITSG